MGNRGNTYIRKRCAVGEKIGRMPSSQESLLSLPASATGLPNKIPVCLSLLVDLSGDSRPGANQCTTANCVSTLNLFLNPSASTTFPPPTTHHCTPHAKTHTPLRNSRSSSLILPLAAHHIPHLPCISPQRDGRDQILPLDGIKRLKMAPKNSPDFCHFCITARNHRRKNVSVSHLARASIQRHRAWLREGFIGAVVINSPWSGFISLHPSRAMAKTLWCRSELGFSGTLLGP